MSGDRMGPEITNAQRIAAARAALARRAADNPEAVQRFEARKARLMAAAKRERERVDMLVLGHDRPPPKVTKVKTRGKRRAVRTPVELAPDVDRALARREEWSHKQGTPETLEHATHTHQDALVQMLSNGSISADQAEWAAEIANVHRSIEADVTVAVASLEARVDQSRSSANLAGEGVKRVRLHHAYTIWRDRLPEPKRLALDMIVGDVIGYTVAATRHRVGEVRAKRVLLEALNRWPDCVALAYRMVDADTVERMNAAE